MLFFLTRGRPDDGVATPLAGRRGPGRLLSAGVALTLVAQVVPAQEGDPASGPPVPEPAEPAVPEAAGQDGAPAAETSIPVHGILRARTIGRWTGSERDLDAYGWASVDVGDPERNRITAHVDGYAALDLDDSDDGPFFGISDTYRNGFDTRLYEAYVDVNRVSGFDRLRFGRQELWTTPVFLSFDGVLVETAEKGDRDLELGAYGGQSVHQFESSPQGDLVAGAYVQARPWKHGRARLDYMHLEDEVNFGDSKNDLWTLGLWQGVRDGLDVEGQYTVLDSKSLDYRVAANAYGTEGGWVLRASFYQLLDTKGQLANEIDPLYTSLLELFPYYQATLLASGTIAERFLLQAGLDIRRVDDAGDVGEFNRDFERYHFTATILDLGREGLDFTLNGDVWDSEGNDVQTWGADVTSPLWKDTTGSVGSYYSLFKYDYFSGSERDNVRTYYARLEHDLTKNLSLDLDYDFEDNDFDGFQTLRVTASWRF